MFSDKLSFIVDGVLKNIFLNRQVYVIVKFLDYEIFHQALHGNFC